MITLLGLSTKPGEFHIDAEPAGQTDHDNSLNSSAAVSTVRPVRRILPASSSVSSGGFGFTFGSGSCWLGTIATGTNFGFGAALPRGAWSRNQVELAETVRGGGAAKPTDKQRNL